MFNAKPLINLTGQQEKRLLACKNDAETTDAIAAILVELGKADTKILKTEIKERFFTLLLVLKNKYGGIYSSLGLKKYRDYNYCTPLLRKAFAAELFRVVDESKTFLYKEDIERLNISPAKVGRFIIRFEGRVDNQRKNVYVMALNGVEALLGRRLVWKGGNARRLAVFFTRTEQLTSDAAMKEMGAKPA